MAEYVFVPTGTRVSSSSELGGPLFRPAEAPKPRAKARPTASRAKAKPRPKGE